MKVLHNITAVTMDAHRRIVTDAAIAFEDDTIKACDKVSTVTSQYPGATQVDGKGMVALPGFIDTHAHADQSLLRGLGDQLHWIPFLDDIIDPWLTRRLADEGVLANKLAMAEMLRGGTTCFVSPNVDPTDDFEKLTGAVDQLGIRAVLGRFIMASEPMDEALAVMSKWDGSADGRVAMWFGLDIPRRPGDAVFPEFYKAVNEAAQDMGVGIVYHFCSEFEDAVYMVNTFGQRPAEWSRDNYALGDNVIVIGGTQMTPLEMQILAETGSHLAHSPVANMKMATGILPLPDVQAAGVNISIGTDGALNNNSYDMLAEMKTGVLLQNATRRVATALTAEQVLEMATINGAKAVGREYELGSLEAGKRADFLLLDMKRPNAVPVHDLVSNIVFSSNGSHVHDVYVDGLQVVDAGKVVGIDEDALIAEANETATVVAERLGFTKESTWPIE